jgi:hypothetical protein
MAKQIAKILVFLLVLGTFTSCAFYPRCPIPGCHVRMIHAHNKKYFRGEPWWKRNQNPKVGQDFRPTAEPLPKYKDK